jgi:membrane protease YdiL (CAAX protease family)
MVLFLKSTWVGIILLTAILAAALFGIHWARDVHTPVYHFSQHLSSDGARIFLYTVVAILADILAPALILGLAMVLLPHRGFRWLTRGPARLFARGGWKLAVGCALVVLLLEEPLWRMQIQPELRDRFGKEGGDILTTLGFFLAHWTPYTNLLAIWSIPRFWFQTWLMDFAGSAWIPMIGHAVGDFFWMGIFGLLGRGGLTHRAPEKAVPLEPT